MGTEITPIIIEITRMGTIKNNIHVFMEISPCLPGVQVVMLCLDIEFQRMVVPKFPFHNICCRFFAL